MKTEIKERKGLYYYVIDGEESEDYTDKQWCQDDMEDRIAEINRENNDLYCPFCNEYFLIENVKCRIEDRSFTAPYGSTFVLGGEVGAVPVCNICKDDLEETK